MMEHVWTVLCTKTSTDRETNNISLFEVLEQMQVAGAIGPLPLPDPALIPAQMELVTLWVRSDFGTPARATGRITLLFPDGSTAGQNEMDIDATATQRARTIMKLPGLPFRMAGVMRFVVSVRQVDAEVWTEVARIPLNVERLEAPQPVAPH